MQKSLTSIAATLLLAALGAGAQAQNLITNGDFEMPAVATNSFNTYTNLGGYAATLWGSDSTSGTHKIVDAADNQFMQFGGGDSAYTAFGVTTGGAYNLNFDYSGSGFWALYNTGTSLFESTGPLVQFSSASTTNNTSSLTLASSGNYKLYFGSIGAGLPVTTDLQLDNVSVTAVTPVPEPESYAMLLAGLGVLGFVSRRRHLR
ncbi:PEP-CTERM sorting domain-containing protein [Sphaerotilus sp.]|uniref:PEP-CTERM sorting domain-containing protein n=1 Tax=Sphaerotilus sp. TaxID=2093942 RepID=UPI00286E22EA|nr:PEP-CTERM sorting domain-containing protein [Sphaerotilus sp.]